MEVAEEIPKGENHGETGRSGQTDGNDDLQTPPATGEDVKTKSILELFQKDLESAKARIQAP